MLTGTETILIQRVTVGTSTNDFGLETETVTTLTVKNCLVAFGSGGEPVSIDRNPVDQTLTLYLPQGTTVEPLDRFFVRGSWWVKDGDAHAWEAPFDFETGVVVSVRRRIG